MIVQGGVLFIEWVNFSVKLQWEFLCANYFDDNRWYLTDKQKQIPKGYTME